MDMAASDSLLRRGWALGRATRGREGVERRAARQLEDQVQKNVSLQPRPAGFSALAPGREAGDSSPLLTERELEEIRRGIRAGARLPSALAWVERLLADHDERVRRDRALAVRLLSVAHE
jgi:hypothetical protein